MSSLSTLYIKKETLQTLLKGLEAKGENGIAINVSINDEANQYNQNVSAFVGQSKEDREAKKPKYYIGNGRTVWTDGTIKAIPYEDKGVQAEAESSKDDLPF